MSVVFYRVLLIIKDQLIPLIFAFWTVGVIMIVGLFFDCRYAIVGPDDLSAINNVMDKAGDVVDKVKDEVNNL